MTNKHPLTDEKALSLFPFERLMDASQPIMIEDAMRTAADWQLEQDQKRLEDFLEKFSWRYSWQATHEVRAFVESFKSYMRPTQEDN